MFGKNIYRKLITTATLAAVWCVYSMVAYAIPTDMAGEITVTGQVTVNGQSAVSNSTILSGSTIVTGADSTATISLGKTGRVEVLANSSLTLNFSETSMVGTLSEGKYRISNAAGVTTTFATNFATIIADASQANSFAVEIECSHTHLDTTTGIVTMREGSSDKQVAAGSTATAGNMEQTGCKPCMRPGSGPNTSIAGFPWLILLAAGVAGVAIFLGTQRDDINTGGGVIVVSPTR